MHRARFQNFPFQDPVTSAPLVLTYDPKTDKPFVYASIADPALVNLMWEAEERALAMTRAIHLKADASAFSNMLDVALYLKQEFACTDIRT